MLQDPISSGNVSPVVAGSSSVHRLDSGWPVFTELDHGVRTIVCVPAEPQNIKNVTIASNDSL